MERRLQELVDSKRTLTDKQFEERVRNDDLVRDLKDIDRLARKVQVDKDLTVEAADRELSEAKVHNKKTISFSIVDHLNFCIDIFRLNFNKIIETYKVLNQKSLL